jgi:hypothetical protein
MEIVCATTILKADSEMPKPDHDDAARLDKIMAEAPSEKPDDEMTDEERLAARMRALDEQRGCRRSWGCMTSRL